MRAPAAGVLLRRGEERTFHRAAAGQARGVGAREEAEDDHHCGGRTGHAGLLQLLCVMGVMSRWRLLHSDLGGGSRARGARFVSVVGHLVHTLAPSPAAAARCPRGHEAHSLSSLHATRGT